MRVPCVGAVVRDRGRLLLVQRGHPPGEGLWSLPGGRVEPGESETEAVAREVREETGLRVDVGPLVGRVERAGPGGATYDIGDYACTVTADVLRAGDDARQARWVPYAEVEALPLTERLLDTLLAWQVLPGNDPR